MEFRSVYQGSAVIGGNNGKCRISEEKEYRIGVFELISVEKMGLSFLEKEMPTILSKRLLLWENHNMNRGVQKCSHEARKSDTYWERRTMGKMGSGKIQIN